MYGIIRTSWRPLWASHWMQKAWMIFGTIVTFVVSGTGAWFMVVSGYFHFNPVAMKWRKA